jgi:hypothetical protein
MRARKIHPDQDVKRVLLTEGETEIATGLGKHTVAKLCREGLLTTVKIGRTKRITAESVQALPARLAERG